jgi:hypothetical protein
MWFRFADYGDGNSWVCWIYESRQEAVDNVTDNAVDESEATVKSSYSRPFEMTLTFPSGVVLSMHDYGSQSVPWDGEVFSYIKTNTPTPETKSESRPETKGSMQQRYRPYSVR